MGIYNVYKSENKNKNFDYSETLIGTVLHDTREHMQAWCDKMNEKYFPDGECTIFYRLVDVKGDLSQIEQLIV